MRQTFLDEAENNRALAKAVEWELQTRMEQTGANKRALDGYTLTITRPTLWDKAALTPLLEYEEIPPVALHGERGKSGAYIAEHTEIVPADWNMTKTKPLAEFSQRARATIELAAVAGEPVLKVTKS